MVSSSLYDSNFVEKYLQNFTFAFWCYMQDFGDSIPGHGGMTDRMDCQVGFEFSGTSTEHSSFSAPVIVNNCKLTKY